MSAEPTLVTQEAPQEEAAVSRASTEAVSNPDVLGTLGINGPLFLAQLVNVTIVIVVLRTWVFKPLAKLMEERKRKIEDGLKHAAEAEKRLTSAKEQENVLLAAARTEARHLVDEARAKGEAERLDRVAQSKRDIDAQVEDAKAKIQAERAQALETVRREVAGLVMQATRKVTSAERDDEAHQAAIERAIKELEQTTV